MTAVDAAAFCRNRCPSDDAIHAGVKAAQFGGGRPHFCGKNATEAVLHSDRTF
jgi:hypothetical protein